MARNANLDKAKRQAVGIYRAASPNAAINGGVAQFSGGEYRLPDAAKDWYRTPKTDDAAIIAAFQGKIKTYPTGLNSSGRVVRLDTNRKRAGCDPRTRSELIPGTAPRGDPIQQCNPDVLCGTVEAARILRV